MSNLNSAKNISFVDTSLNWDDLVNSTRKSPESDDKLYKALIPEISRKMSLDFGSFDDFNDLRLEAKG